jgi:hypothetical protein
VFEPTIKANAQVMSHLSPLDYRKNMGLDIILNKYLREQKTGLFFLSEQKDFDNHFWCKFIQLKITEN